MVDPELMVTDEENQLANQQQLWFDQVKIAAERTRSFIPVGDAVTTHHWVAATVHSFSKFLPWHFDLQAFKIAMTHAAAMCMRACLWADETMARRAALVAEKTAAAQAAQIEENEQTALADQQAE